MSSVRALSPLVGLNVLAVEDEGIVAMLLEDLLSELGCNVIGPAARLEHAFQLLDTHVVNAAVLDVNVAGKKVFPVADRLQQLGVPFVFATGYGAAGVAEGHSDRIVLQKPYSADALRFALERAVRGS